MYSTDNECVCVRFCKTVSTGGNGAYGEPNEADYYQQKDPDGLDGPLGGPAGPGTPHHRGEPTPSLADSTVNSKPMPTESSFFIFSSKNR